MGGTQRGVRVGVPLIIGGALAAAHGRGTPVTPGVRADSSPPARLAVAMHTGGQSSPFTVEVRDGSWIVITFLPRAGGPRAEPPDGRIIVTADQLRVWSDSVHALLGDSGHVVPFQPAPRTPALGRGRPQLQWLGRFTATMAAPRFAETLCGTGENDSAIQGPRTEVVQALALLDSALAHVSTGVPPAPSVTRAYLPSEVSCPPIADSANPAPQFPASVPPGERRPTTIGVHFIVDRSGRVEDGSLAFLPGTDSRLADAARAVIAQWAFRPAEWDGTRVRGIVDEPVGFDAFGESAVLAPRSRLPRPQVHADSDGWVRVWVPVPLGWAHEWYTPDEVDRWVADLGVLSTAVSVFNATDRSGAFLPEPDRVELGAPNGIRYDVTALAPAPPPARAGGPGRAGGFGPAIRTAVLSTADHECGGFGSASWLFDSADVGGFSVAARAARAARSPPVDATTYVHASTDVGCPAWLPGRGTGAMVVYPTPPYPPSLAATHPSASILASFVVDVGGKADSASLRVLPGSDASAVAALTAWLPLQRFTAATRDGIPVRELIIRTFLFEPPVVCLHLNAAPTCPSG